MLPSNVVYHVHMRTRRWLCAVPSVVVEATDEADAADGEDTASLRGLPDARPSLRRLDLSTAAPSLLWPSVLFGGCAGSESLCLVQHVMGRGPSR